MEVFARLRAEHGITVIVITHERDIAAWGTRTIDFRDGRIVSDRANEVAAAGMLKRLRSAAPVDRHRVPGR